MYISNKISFEKVTLKLNERLKQDCAMRSLPWCFALPMLLCVSSVFCCSSLVNFTKEKLLNIQQFTPVTFSPVFIEPDTFMEILVDLYGICRRCRQGKRTGALDKLRQQGLRTLLLFIPLVNVHSLVNKMEELLLLK